MKELYHRFLFTIFVLIVFRIGSYIPLAGINMQILESITAQNQNGVLGMFNILSGGSLGRMSIFALAIVPYITSSIIIQLLSMAYKPLEDLKKEGENGKRKITQLSRYLTIALAAFQAYGIAAGVERLGGNIQLGSIIIISSGLFKFTAVITLVTGTLLLMWLGEQITLKGLGNGSSLIIFTGIVSGLPSALISGFELARRGAESILVTLLLLLVVLLMIVIIVFFERAVRKVYIQYPKNRGVNVRHAPESTYMPLKLNTAGVIPPMFASSILLFPLTIANFTNSQSKVAEWLVYNLGHGKPIFIAVYALLIICFTFFYTALIFNTEEIANNLKRAGSFIPGKRPGNNTAQHLDFLLTRTSVLGALYLCVICIIPEFLMNKFAISFALGGTSLLIVVNVVLETVTQMQSYTFGNKYESLMKRMKFRGRGG